MRTLILTVAALVTLAALSAPAHAADTYTVDPIHSSVTFKIMHAGLNYIHGRFDQVSGSFTLDRDDPSKSSFTLTINPASVDTNNSARDTHLRGPDFFNVKQFPTLSFKSTSVKAVDGGYEVTGDLAMHGETRSITFSLRGGKTLKLMGMERTGFSTDLVLKRSDFGMDKALNMLGDEIPTSIGFQGIKK
jgi:polyisoprenoid-binding protein YceI